MPEARVSLLYLSGVLFRTSCKMCVDTRSTAAATLRASFSLNVNSEAFLKEINADIFAFSCKQPNANRATMLHLKRIIHDRPIVPFLGLVVSQSRPWRHASRRYIGPYSLILFS